MIGQLLSRIQLLIPKKVKEKRTLEPSPYANHHSQTRLCGRPKTVSLRIVGYSRFFVERHVDIHLLPGAQVHLDCEISEKISEHAVRTRGGTRPVSPVG